MESHSDETFLLVLVFGPQTEGCCRYVQWETMGGNYLELLVSHEMGGKSLSLRISLVTEIPRGLGNFCATGNSHILEAITLSSSVQISI